MDQNPKLNQNPKLDFKKSKKVVKIEFFGPKIRILE